MSTPCLIKLTRHGEPVYVNPHQFLFLKREEQAYINAPTRRYTTITFALTWGDPEGSSPVQIEVKETPQRIMELMKKGTKDA